jgi:hypothetical protein
MHSKAYIFFVASKYQMSDDGSDAGSDDGTPWEDVNLNDLKAKELVKELKRRSLRTSGIKTILVTRLQVNYILLCNK